MDKEKYYIVTEDDAPVIGVMPTVNGKAVILCEQPRGRWTLVIKSSHISAQK
jgi:hypothetical protein